MRSIKMKNEKLKALIIPVITLILAFAIWQSAAFLKKSYFVLPTILSKKLPFRESPVKLGGYEAANVYLASSVYPGIDSLKNNQSAEELLKHIEIENYTVRFPLEISNVKRWNIDIRFKDLKLNLNNPSGIDLLKGAIYIEADSEAKNGFDKPRFANENIVFPEGFFWDYKIEYNSYNNKAKMFSAASGKEYDVDYILLTDKKTLRFKLPLVEKINGKMDKKAMGLHIAAFGFTSIEEKNKSIITEYFPKEYYSFAAESISPNDNGFMKLVPISVNGDVSANKNNSEADITRKLEEIAKSQSAVSNFKPSDFDLIKLGFEMYNKQKFTEAETELLKYKNTSSTACALLGVMISSKAKSEKDLIKKMKYVENAFKIFDQGEKLIKTDGDKYIFYTNRAGTSMEVPDEIFGKLEVAEKDLRKVLTLNLTDKEKAASYLKLIKIYKIKKPESLNSLYGEIKKDIVKEKNKA
jgi:hypothetical protein